MDAHVPHVVFPRLPADGPDPDDELHRTGDGQRIVNARVAAYRRMCETAAMTVPLAPSAARAVRRYAIVGRFAGSIQLVMFLIAVAFIVHGVWVDRSMRHTGGPFFFGMAAIAGHLRQTMRPSVTIQAVPAGVLLRGLTAAFVTATIALNPPGTVSNRGSAE
jgi:hypothetical protein